MWCLAVLVVLTLLVPNVVLCFTEHLQPAASMANILVPAGFFMMLVAASRRTGVTALLSLPFMIFAAFQIVLLYLYGNSVIAVDMFLNVVTTNVSEATELLANLLMAMTTVCLLYLPPLIWGICAAIRRREITPAFRKKMLVGGLITALAGGLPPAWRILYSRITISAGRLSPSMLLKILWKPVTAIARHRVMRSCRVDSVTEPRLPILPANLKYICS